MVIRLVQTFKGFRLAMEDHPESLPPPEWKASGVGRKVVEKANLKSHLTIYAKVRHSPRPSLNGIPYEYYPSFLSGWTVGKDGRGLMERLDPLQHVNP